MLVYQRVTLMNHSLLGLPYIKVFIRKKPMQCSEHLPTTSPHNPHLKSSLAFPHYGHIPTYSQHYSDIVNTVTYSDSIPKICGPGRNDGSQPPESRVRFASSKYCSRRTGEARDSFGGSSQPSRSAGILQNWWI